MALFSLPAELRNCIYELAFSDETPRREIDIFEARKLEPPYALAATCRLIRRETMHLIPEARARYHINIFGHCIMPEEFRLPTQASQLLFCRLANPSSLPKLSTITIRIGSNADFVCEYLFRIVRYTNDSVVEIHRKWDPTLHTRMTPLIRSMLHTGMTLDIGMMKCARALKIKLIRKAGTEYLDLPNVFRLLYEYRRPQERQIEWT